MSALSAPPGTNGQEPASPGAAEQPDEVTNDLYGQFKALIPKVEAELRRRGKDREAMVKDYRKRREAMDIEHRAALSEFDAQTRVYESMLKPFGITPPGQPAKSSAGRPADTGGGSKRPGKGVVKSVLRYILERGEEYEFWAAALHRDASLPHNHTSTPPAVKLLYEHEILRKAGGVGPRGAMMYKLRDRELAQEYLTKLESEDA